MEKTTANTLQKTAISILGLALILAAIAGWNCSREIHSLPVKVALPMGGCQFDQRLASVVAGRLKLAGEADAATVSEMRASQKLVWWVSGTDDALRAGQCPGCRRDVDAARLGLRVRFATNRDCLNEASRASVEQLTQSIARCPVAGIHVRGAADLRKPGMTRYNQDLSDRRAATVLRLLAKDLPPPVVLTTDGLGATDQFTPKGVSRNSAPGWAENRRADVSIKFQNAAKEIHNMQSLLPPDWAYSMFWGCWALAGVVGIAAGAATVTLILHRLGWQPEKPKLDRDWPPPPEENRLEIIEGIGPYFARKIEEATRIRTILELAGLYQVAVIAKIAALRPNPGPDGRPLPAVGTRKVYGWIAMAKLIQIPTVTKDWAEVFVAAGIHTVEELAGQEKHALLEKIHAANRTHQHVLAQSLPTALELDYIIANSRDLVLARVQSQVAANRDELKNAIHFDAGTLGLST